MEGFVITDAAAKMAQRLGVVFTQEQADAMRRRVAEIEAEVRSLAYVWGWRDREAARHRLEVLREAQSGKRSIDRLDWPSAAESLGQESAGAGAAESGRT